MHFSLSQTLAVESQEPLSRVPNLPDDNVQTAGRRRAEGSTRFFGRGDGTEEEKAHPCFCGPSGCTEAALDPGRKHRCCCRFRPSRSAPGGICQWVQSYRRRTQSWSVRTRSASLRSLRPGCQRGKTHENGAEQPPKRHQPRGAAGSAWSEPTQMNDKANLSAC